MSRPCVTGKHAFATSRAAKAAVRRARTHKSQRRRERSAYQCEHCGAFHLTSLEPDGHDRFR